MSFYTDLSSVLEKKVDLNSVMTQYYRNFIVNKVYCIEDKDRGKDRGKAIDIDTDNNTSIPNLSLENNHQKSQSQAPDECDQQEHQQEPYCNTQYDSLPTSDFNELQAIYQYNYIKNVNGGRVTDVGGISGVTSVNGGGVNRDQDQYQDQEGLMEIDMVADIETKPITTPKSQSQSQLQPQPVTELDMAVCKILTLLDSYDINTTYAANRPR